MFLLKLFNLNINFCFDVKNLFTFFSPLNLYGQFDLLKYPELPVTF